MVFYDIFIVCNSIDKGWILLLLQIEGYHVIIHMQDTVQYPTVSYEIMTFDLLLETYSIFGVYLRQRVVSQTNP